MADKKNDILTRSYLVFAGFLLFALVIMGRVTFLQVYQGEYWKNKADSLMLDYKSIEPMRGNIYTADGSLLATSLPRYDVHVDFRAPFMSKENFDANVDSLALCLSNLFRDRSKEDYKHLLKDAHRDGERYHLLKRNISYRQQKALRDFPIFRKGKNKGGLILDQSSRRERPFRILAARTIGFKVDNKIVNPVGIEGAFDNELCGTKGQRLMQRIAGGVWKPVNTENEIEPRDGFDVITTIDLNLQDVAENALMKMLQEQNADKGCAVLMEVSTGQIKAIANLTRKGDESTYNEDYNYAIGYKSEPGSTFKLASLMAAIEDGYIDIDDSTDTRGGRMVLAGGKVIEDSHTGGPRMISIRKSFASSSNVGTIDIIQKAYRRNPQAFIDRLRSMHVGEQLSLQLKGEAVPRLKNTTDKDWSALSLPYLSIGYETSLTPLNLLTFYNAVANNGKMVRPLFVKEIRNKGEVIKKFNTDVIADSICSSSTIRQARILLEEVVKSGTASHIKHAQYSIAGKTGTAQIAYGNEGYGAPGNKKYQASFCGYFPADNPRYSCVVVVYGPGKSAYYGASIACPVFKDIADKVYALDTDMHKEVVALPDSLLVDANPIIKAGRSASAIKATRAIGLNERIPATGWMRVDKTEFSAVSDKVPNVAGMGLRDAVYLLERQGLQVKPVGRGSVIRQSILPGTKIQRGSLITIELG